MEEVLVVMSVVVVVVVVFDTSLLLELELVLLLLDAGIVGHVIPNLVTAWHILETNISRLVVVINVVMVVSMVSVLRPGIYSASTRGTSCLRIGRSVSMYGRLTVFVVVKVSHCIKVFLPTVSVVTVTSTSKSVTEATLFTSVVEVETLVCVFVVVTVPNDLLTSVFVTVLWMVVGLFVTLNKVLSKVMVAKPTSISESASLIRRPLEVSSVLLFSTLFPIWFAFLAPPT